jgi:hypothetical protein
LEDAPVRTGVTLPECPNIDDEITLSTYNSYTGEKTWSYKYYRVGDYSRLYFEDEGVYLTGSANHGDSRSLAKVDIDTGLLLSLMCTSWPSDPILPPSTAEEGIFWPPNNMASTDQELACKTLHPLFVAQDTRLNILDSQSKEVLGYVEFEGEKLDSLSTDVVVQNDLAIVYLDDSDQFFGFRFWLSFPLHN